MSPTSSFPPSASLLPFLSRANGIVTFPTWLQDIIARRISTKRRRLLSPSFSEKQLLKSLGLVVNLLSEPEVNDCVYDVQVEKSFL